MPADPVPDSERPDALEETLDADLARYAELTSRLQVSADFEDRLLARVEPKADLWRVGRIALVAFASAALVALAFDLDSRSTLDDTVLAGYDLVETEEDP